MRKSSRYLGSSLRSLYTNRCDNKMPVRLAQAHYEIRRNERGVGLVLSKNSKPTMEDIGSIFEADT